jgi:hypothetical protein
LNGAPAPPDTGRGGINLAWAALGARIDKKGFGSRTGASDPWADIRAHPYPETGCDLCPETGWVTDALAREAINRGSFWRKRPKFDRHVARVPLEAARKRRRQGIPKDTYAVHHTIVLLSAKWKVAMSGTPAQSQRPVLLNTPALVNAQPRQGTYVFKVMKLDFAHRHEYR